MLGVLEGRGVLLVMLDRQDEGDFASLGRNLEMLER